MPLSGAERLSVSQSFLACYGESSYWCGRTLQFIFKRSGINLLADVQSAALTWQPFIDAQLSIAAWNLDLARIFNSDQI